MFTKTLAIKKLRKLTKRKRIVQGGTWGAKTYGIIACFIQIATTEENKILTIVAETIPAIKHGALRNFMEIMQETGRWFDSHYNASEREYRFDTGSKIQFTSFDTIGKAQASGKRNYLFINEANYISFAIADALMMRTSETIWIDFNPTEEFWAHTEIMPQEDAEFLLLKYTDNECLPESIHKELLMKIEKAKTSGYWANWCKVYIDGEIGSLEGIIFPNKKIVSKFPENCKWIVYGMDFGYTNDPSTLVKIGLSDGELYFEEELYQSGLTNQDLIRILKQKNVGRAEIIADSAEPKSIREIQIGGFNIKGAEKGKDSIKNGIDLLHRYELNIVEGSTNLIQEFRKYSWDIDKATGKPTNTPIDLYNHCFVGETLITTIEGLKRIDKIKIGDLVLTSKGYKKVVKVFNNGKRQVNNYLIQCDMFLISLTATKNHLIKTNLSWTEISQLQSGQMVYLHKPSMEKNTNFMQGKNIFQEEKKECTLPFGNFIKGKSKKGFMCITQKTNGQMKSKILNSKKEENIYLTTKKNGREKTENLFYNTSIESDRLLKHGIKAKMESSNIKNKPLKRDSENGITETQNVFNVKKNLLKKRTAQNSAIQIAKLKHLEKDGKKMESVYDLMVEDCHEYFANGILVHNCIDCLRYSVSYKLQKPKTSGVPSSRLTNSW